MFRVTSNIPYIAIIFLSTIVKAAAADTTGEVLIGYDCGSKIQNVTTLSSVDIDDADFERKLPIASTEPDEFALRYMGGPGYMAVLAGEAMHIVQCIPVNVKIHQREKCYNRLPILRGDDALFLTPRTRIITKYATEVSCHPALLEQYKIQGTWYKFIPEPVHATEPLNLKGSAKLIWNLNPVNLATNGVHTQQDQDTMNERIMFGVDKGVVLDSVAQQVTDKTEGSISFLNIFSSDLKEQIAEDVWSKTWGKFIGFGTTCAGIMGIFVCFSMIKTVADCVINGYALYKVFGFSFKLLGAGWDTFAIILLSKEK